MERSAADMFEAKNKMIMDKLEEVNINFEKMREEHNTQVDLFNHLDK